jgi:hypothetical protein
MLGQNKKKTSFGVFHVRRKPTRYIRGATESAKAKYAPAKHPHLCIMLNIFER